jgi:hypothetical protein
LVLGYKNDGTYNGTFDFVVEADGLYPFRFIYYERGGGAHVEWFAVNRTTGERTLIDDPQQTTSIKAYRGVTAPTMKLVVASSVNGTYQVDANAVFDTANRTVTTQRPSDARFYQLLSDKAEKITYIRISGNTVVLKY